MHLVNLAGDNSYWFGLDDINQEGTFQWIDGTQLDNNEYVLNCFIHTYTHNNISHTLLMTKAMVTTQSGDRSICSLLDCRWNLGTAQRSL